MDFDLSKPRFDKTEIVKSCNNKEVIDLDNISVELLNYTPIETLNNYIPELCFATWNHNVDNFRQTLSDDDRKQIMDMFWSCKCIPTAMRSVQITVLLKGITTHDVTHLIRHTGLSFAADCTGDKYIEQRPLIIPSFFIDIDDKYRKRYVDIMQKSYELYDDLCNECKDTVHVQDARLVLPRTLETFYYITGNLFDFMRMLKQRIDMQFQPKSDNIWALRIYEAIKKVYPKFNIDIHAKNNFYCNLAKDGAVLSSNWYNPEKQDENKYTLALHTVYGDMHKMSGYNYYKQLEQNIESNINNILEEK